MKKILIVIFVSLIFILFAEASYYFYLTKVQKTPTKNPPTPQIFPSQTFIITPTSLPPIDIFKKISWDLTDIQNYPDGTKAAIVKIVKLSPDASYFEAFFKSGQTRKILVDEKTKYFVRKIIKEGYSSTTEGHFSIEENTNILLTWKDETPDYIEALTITKKIL